MSDTLQPPLLLLPAPEPAAPTQPIPVDDNCREAYALRRAGKRVEEIATHFGVDRSTIYRWVENYKEAYRKAIEGTPIVHLIAEELSKLEAIEQDALAKAEATKSDRARASYQRIALQSIKARVLLMLEAGIIPKAPEKIYSVVSHLKPQVVVETSGQEERSREEVIADINKLLSQPIL